MAKNEFWCSDCGHRFNAGEKPPVCCPDCGKDCLIPAAIAVPCSCEQCDRPAVDPSRGLHMCSEHGDAYMHGF